MRETLLSHSLKYWLSAVFIFLTLSIVSPHIYKYLKLEDARNFLFLKLTQTATNPASARAVELVLIEDDEFWSGRLHHRTPTDRSYLADLITKIAAAGPRLIALDFDMRLPSAKPGDYVAPGQFNKGDTPYQAETESLIKAIDAAAAQNHFIVLAKSIAKRPHTPSFDLLPDAFMPYGICNRLEPNNRWDNRGAAPGFLLTPDQGSRISCGYIALMPDRRQVPPPIELNGTRAMLDSFPVAIARALNEVPLGDLTQGPHYAAYLSSVNTSILHGSDPIPCVLNSVAVSAGCVMTRPGFAAQMLHDRAVIIGVDWSTLGYGAGERVDHHDSPLGSISGALLNANIAEALISGRFFRSPSERAMFWIEQGLGLLAILALGAVRTKLGALAMTTLLIFAALIVQRECLLNLALFVDMYLPVIGVGVHAFIDILRHEQPGGDAQYGRIASH